MARNPDLGRNLFIGCFMTPLGLMSGAMVGVLVSKIVAWLTNAPACEGIPTCNWYVYAGWGALVGLTLPGSCCAACSRARRRPPPAGARSHPPHLSAPPARRTIPEDDTVARVDVIMPQMGESIAEGTMSRWLKKVGDEVKRDEPIFEISTDKVDAEIPSPAAGILAEVSVTEGQTVAVGTVVARLETDKAAFAAGAGRPGAAAAAAAATPASAPRGRRAPAAPSAAAPAGARQRRRGRRSTQLVRGARAHQELAARAEDGRRARASRSPGMQGSGVAGRVTKRDLEAALAGGDGARRRGAAAGATQVPAQPAIAAAAVQGGAGAKATNGTGAMAASLHGDLQPPAVESMPGDVVEPMSRIRQLTAEHMVLSRRWNAHVTSFFEVDLTRVARIRAKQRAEFERATGEKLTYLPFIIKAVTDGLKQYPALNAAVRGNELVLRKQYNIGIAVALDWGLIVPVIKNADDLSLTGLTRQLNDLANRARRKKLQPAEVQGATFTITNPGVFGSLMGTPIIPVPTSGIMGVGAIEKRPRSSPAPTARTRSPCAPAATSRSRSTTASSTGPTPTASWPRSRRRSRASPRPGSSSRAGVPGHAARARPPLRRRGRGERAGYLARLAERAAAPGRPRSTSGRSRTRPAPAASSSSSRRATPRPSTRRSSTTTCSPTRSTSATPRGTARGVGAFHRRDRQLTQPPHALPHPHRRRPHLARQPTGFVTAYNLDEIGVMFVAGTATRARCA
jgi:2-oxoglutarate dehydrogenase E2 component (dihydrolipoamide succinyltransferase)